MVQASEGAFGQVLQSLAYPSHKLCQMLFIRWQRRTAKYFGAGSAGPWRDEVSPNHYWTCGSRRRSSRQ
jgi:hypothetical protein